MKRRVCLRCSDLFKSTGPENRRCPKCLAWMGSEECPYSDGNFLYATSVDDAESIQIRRHINTVNAKHLRKKGA